MKIHVGQLRLEKWERSNSRYRDRELSTRLASLGGPAKGLLADRVTGLYGITLPSAYLRPHYVPFKLTIYLSQERLDESRPAQDQLSHTSG